jgi:hypothetical protein
VQKGYQVTLQCPISCAQQHFALEKYQIKEQFDNQIQLILPRL